MKLKNIRSIDRELWKAAATGMPTAVRLLLAEGANPKSINTMTDTALMLACYNGNADAVHILAPVSDCSYRNKNDNSAWNHCGLPWRTACALALIPHIDIHEIHADGRTPYQSMMEMNLGPDYFTEADRLNVQRVIAAMVAKDLLGVTGAGKQASRSKGGRL